MDGAILVVNAATVNASNKRAYSFSSSSWCTCYRSVLNKIDTVKDKELVDLVEEEIRELLTSYKFPGDKIPIVKGSALNAVEGKDEATGKNEYGIDESSRWNNPTTWQAKRQTFLDASWRYIFYLWQRYSSNWKSRVWCNKIGEIEIVGIRDTKKSVCTGVEMFRKLLDSGEAGDNIGALLRGVERDDVERGQVLCKPGSILLTLNLSVRLTFWKKRRVEDILRLNIDLSFILELQM